MSVPKLLHVTWKTKELPSHFEKNLDKWRQIHPDLKVCLYDDRDLRKEVELHYPEYLSAYDSFDKQINRVDFARLAILAKHGGIYSDLDAVPLKRLDDLLETDKPILGEEAKEHSKYLYDKDSVVCNALMISPKSEHAEKWWRELMSFIAKEYPTLKSKGVVGSTGPMAITLFLEQNPSALQGCTILSACAFFPLLDGTNKKLGRLPPSVPTEHGEVYVSRECDLRDAYAVHLWDHSWFFSPQLYISKHPVDAFAWVVMICLFVFFAWKVFSQK